jgi:CheY-like chemotaxis protein
MTDRILSVLNVDDSSNNRMVLDLYLEDYLTQIDTVLDLSVDHASDGAEAVARAKDRDYDIIFMDIMMDGMDGIEATRQIMQLKPDSLIIGISAADRKSLVQGIVEGGAKEVIPKPIQIGLLYERLDHYLGL